MFLMIMFFKIMFFMIMFLMILFLMMFSYVFDDDVFYAEWGNFYWNTEQHLSNF